MTEIDTPLAARESTEPASDRRALLAKLAIGGAGAAVGAVALGRSASAGDGDPIRIGQSGPNNTGTLPTIVSCVTGTDPTTSGASAFSFASDSVVPDLLPFPASCGGYGGSDFVHGVHGSTANREGYGCISANLAPPATTNEFAPRGTAIACENGPQLYFVPLENAVSGPTPGLHDSGEVYCDADRTLWYTAPEPTAEDPDNVRFVKLCGEGTAGALTYLDFPQRVADTRLNNPGPRPLPGGNIVVDLKTTLTGAASGVTAGIAAALLTVTVTNTTARGFYAVAAAGIVLPDEAFSTDNWVGDNLSVAQTVQARVSPEAEIQVQLGGIGACDVIVDVIGVYA